MCHNMELPYYTQNLEVSLHRPLRHKNKFEKSVNNRAVTVTLLLWKSSINRGHQGRVHLVMERKKSRVCGQNGRSHNIKSFSMISVGTHSSIMDASLGNACGASDISACGRYRSISTGSHDDSNVLSGESSDVKQLEPLASTS